MSKQGTKSKHDDVAQQPNWPNALSEKALIGLAGKVMELIEPQSESDPAALLIQFLTAFGNSVGPKPYFLVEADKHHANLFSLIVGKTARSRKGTSFGRIRKLFELASEQLLTIV